MPQFIVPKFIEHKAKIVGPLTLQQFMFIGGAGVICFILYFSVSFYLFILGSLLALLVGAGLAFGKIGGRSFLVVLKNFLFFSLGPKMYLWRKKTGLPPKLKDLKEAPTIEKLKETTVPTAVGRSKLKNLSTYVETGAKK